MEKYLSHFREHFLVLLDRFRSLLQVPRRRVCRFSHDNRGIRAYIMSYKRSSLEIDNAAEINHKIFRWTFFAEEEKQNGLQFILQLLYNTYRGLYYSNVRHLIRFHLKRITSIYTNRFEAGILYFIHRTDIVIDNKNLFTRHQLLQNIIQS